MTSRLPIEALPDVDMREGWWDHFGGFGWSDKRIALRCQSANGLRLLLSPRNHWSYSIIQGVKGMLVAV
jgi:hypothetical protein